MTDLHTTFVSLFGCVLFEGKNRKEESHQFPTSEGVYVTTQTRGQMKGVTVTLAHQIWLKAALLFFSLSNLGLKDE